MSTPDSSGLNHAPSFIETTPLVIRSVTFTGMIVAPRSLKTRTCWPSEIDRSTASSVCTQTTCGSTACKTVRLPKVEWDRAFDCGVTSCSGCARSASNGGTYFGIAGIEPRP